MLANIWLEYFFKQIFESFHQSKVELSDLGENWAKTSPLLLQIFESSNCVDSHIVHCGNYCTHKHVDNDQCNGGDQYVNRDFRPLQPEVHLEGWSWPRDRQLGGGCRANKHHQFSNHDHEDMKGEPASAWGDDRQRPLFFHAHVQQVVIVIITMAGRDVLVVCGSIKDPIVVR